VLETASLGEQLENELKREIMDGRLAPGTCISIGELAARWDVSSTPVRDAIRRLESKGFIKVNPRRGVYVAQMDAATFRNVFELRIALECQAVESATRNAPVEAIEHAIEEYRDAQRHFQQSGDRSLMAERDYTVHDLLMRFCTNDKLVQIMRELRDLIDWAQATIVSRRPDAYDITINEHLQVLEAMYARDVSRARTAIRDHLEGALARYTGGRVA
jgi:DNA-binding GntR family transcriptional regulator